MNKQFFEKSRLYLLLCGLLLCSFTTVSAQYITGTVLDQNNETVIGANIKEVGSESGTITDFEGNFSLKLTSGTAETAAIEVSYIGYKTQTIQLNGRTTIKVDLEEESTGLQEVVAIAYGVQKKETLTGSIASVSTEKLLASPNTSVANALQGNMPGITSIQESGQPGEEDPKIFIRGLGSLTEGASSPLILVDGVENSFSQMDPNEIESITILKDASATAVFGVRGANGVILVTTRRGEKGKARISITSNVGFLTPTRMLDLADSYDFANAINQMADNDKSTRPFNDYAIERYRLGDDPIMYPSIDWRDEYMKGFSVQTQHNVNVSGGTDKVRYFISAGYLFQDGLLEQFEHVDYDNGFSYNRFNYRANLDFDITRTTKMKLGIGGILGKRHTPDNADEMWVLFNQSAPMASAGIDENGNIIGAEPKKFDPLLMDNNFLNGMYNKGYHDKMNSSSTFDLVLNQKLDFITKGLEIEVKGTYNSSYEHTKKQTGSRSNLLNPYYKSDLVDGTNVDAPGFDPDKTPGYDKTIVYEVGQWTYRERSFSESKNRGRNWYLEGSLRYNRKFGDHTVSGLVLYNQSKKYYMGGDYNAIPRAYVGLVGRVTYDYKSKYMAEFNAGYNGSENFAEGKRFGLFPSGSVGYTISQEDFLKDNKVINYLKIRASVGLVGNDYLAGKRFMYLPDAYAVDQSQVPGGWKTNNYGYNFGSNAEMVIKGAGETVLGNPDVTWEKALKQNYGIDFYTLDSRLKLSADYFREDRKDILITRNTVPVLTGLTKDNLPAANLGRVKNQGYEIELKWSDKVNDFRYNIGFNMAYVRNKIIAMDEVDPKFDYMARTGSQVGARFGYVSDGLYQAEDFVYDNAGEIAIDPQTGYTQLVSGVSPGANVYPGDVKYLDQNGDNKIDVYDVREIGNPKRPLYNFGLNLGFDYKGWFASATLAGVTGCDHMMGGDFRYSDNRNYFQFQLDECWTPENTQDAILPRMSSASKTNNTYDSQIWMRDGSYLKLKNLSVGYKITDQRILKPIGAQSLSVKLTGYNLLTFDYLKIMDPEGNPSDADKYPITRNATITVNLTF